MIHKKIDTYFVITARGKQCCDWGEDGCLAPGIDVPIIMQLDVMIVPCVAVDKQGNRLGRGRGVYDQLLADYATYSIGVAHVKHQLDIVPVEPHDQPVQAVILAE